MRSASVSIPSMIMPPEHTTRTGPTEITLLTSNGGRRRKAIEGRTRCGTSKELGREGAPTLR